MEVLTEDQREASRKRLEWYDSYNIKFMKLKPLSKEPIGKFKEAIADGVPDAALHTVLHFSNIGVIPGKRIVILDIDVKNGVNGLETLTKMGVKMPATYTVATPNNGHHAYMLLPNTVDRYIQNANGYPGLEFITGDRKYVVAPPSQLVKGADRYRVERDYDILDCPPELLDIFRAEEIDRGNYERVSFGELSTTVKDIKNDGLDYQSWLEVGMAIHYETEGSASGYELWEKWSRRSGKFDHAKQMKSWNSFSSDHGTVITYGTLRRLRDEQPLQWEDMGAVDKEGIVVPETSRPVAPARPNLPGGMPGMAGKIESWVETQMRFDNPELAWVSALHIISALTDNRYVAGDSEVPLNLYSLAVMETGKGKESLRQVILTMLKSVLGSEVANQIAVDHFSSGSSIVTALSAHRNRLWMPDEFGMYLESSKGQAGGYKSEVISAMMSASANARGTMSAKLYAKSKNALPAVEYPFFSTMATTTPETLNDAISGTRMVENGMLNRSIPVIVEHAGKRKWDVVKTIPSIEITDWAVRTIKEGESCSAERPRVIPITEEAKRHLWSWCEECDTRGPLWVRAWENAMKLCGLVALGDTGIIEIGHAKWAIGKVESGYRALDKGINEAPVDERSSYTTQQAKILKYMHRFLSCPEDEIQTRWRNEKFLEERINGLIPRSMVLKATNMKAKAFNEVIETMKESGVLDVVEKNTEGAQKKTAYFVLLK